MVFALKFKHRYDAKGKRSVIQLYTMYINFHERVLCCNYILFKIHVSSYIKCSSQKIIPLLGVCLVKHWKKVRAQQNVLKTV